MFVIGMTGNAGCGKSFVCGCAAELLRCPVIDSDSVCRDLMMPGHRVFDDVVRTFGSSYVGADGYLDRGKLAATVFNDEAARKLLNSLTHPATIEEIRSLIERYTREGYGIVIVESALAEEAGYRDFCDELWLVTAPYEDRVTRLRGRGYSDSKIKSVMESQTSQEALLAAGLRQIANGDGVGKCDIFRAITDNLDDALTRPVWRKLLRRDSCHSAEDMV